MTRMVFVDPPYREYDGGRLFDRSNPRLNRDDYLLPYVLAKERLERRGARVETGDFALRNGNAAGSDFYSLGLLDRFLEAARHGARLRAFAVFEPPVVAPGIYDALPRLTARFERVYVHNVHGDGYSLAGVDASKLRKLWWPQQYDDVLAKHWANRDRQAKAVVINNNKKPRRHAGELYSKRIEAIAELARWNAVDVYGGGWNKWLMREGRLKWAIWKPAFRHRRALRSAWRGAPPSKYDVLARYEFSLCLENMRMDGYTTEKMWDCFYAGTIPIYLGPKDIAKMVPDACFIDASRFGSWSEAWDHARSLSPQQRQDMREAGREFLRGEASRPFKDSLVNILSE